MKCFEPKRLKSIGIVIPKAPTAIGNFSPGIISGSILYVSGTYGTIKNENGADIFPKSGKLGDKLTINDGYESARNMLLNHLALSQIVLGDLNRIVRPVRLVGYVNAVSGFQDAPSVLNGASDLLLEIFGTERGQHARMALYQHELARNAPVAGEIMFEVEM